MAGFDFVQADHTVFVLVILLKKLFPRRIFVFGLAVRFGREEKQSVADHRRCAGIATHALNHRCSARLERVALQTERTAG